MFRKLKDAYDKYILMEERFNQLNEKLSSALQRIEVLEKIIKTPAPSKYACKSCGKGIYRATNETRYLLGQPVGCEWKCDKCNHIADEIQSQKLSML